MRHRIEPAAGHRGDAVEQFGIDVRRGCVIVIRVAQGFERNGQAAGRGAGDARHEIDGNRFGDERVRGRDVEHGMFHGCKCADGRDGRPVTDLRSGVEDRQHR